MGVLCVECNARIHGGIDEFKQHLAESGHGPPYKCGEGDCGDRIRIFRHKNSLIRHLKDQHLNSLPPSEEEDEPSLSQASHPASDEASIAEDHVPFNPPEPLDDPPRAPEDDLDLDLDFDFEKDVERAAALMILRLRKRGNVPGTAISIFIEECQELIVDLLTAAQRKIGSNLKSANVSEVVINQCVENIYVQEPFKNLKSKEQQIKYFESNFNLVMPVPKLIKLRYDQRREPSSHLIDTQVPCSYQYISVEKTLTALLNNPVFYKLVHEERPSTDGILRSYLDGDAVDNHDLIRDCPQTLRLVLFADAFECVNPLSSKTKVHKIMGVYYQVQNLPPEENARLRSVHVAAYGYSEDFDTERWVDTMLDALYEELEELESREGVTVQVNGRPYKLRATVIAWAVDGEAAQELLGLLASGANRFCRRCLVSRCDMHRDIFAMGEPRTRELLAEHVAEVKRLGADAQKLYGVKRECSLTKKAKYANSPADVAFDGFHDILRGVAQMEIKLCLHEFIVKKKYLSVDDLNASVQSFDYGVVDRKNKPSPNFSLKSLSSFGSYGLRGVGTKFDHLTASPP